jgi:hypothetical protein
VTASRRRWLYGLAWLAWLAMVPWWLGLPLLVSMVAALLIPTQRLTVQVPVLRLALRWGLPGVLFALQRALGGDALAWGMALLGALAGFTLLAGLEAWLDRGQYRRSIELSSATPEWRELALAPIGPSAAIIELQPPEWFDAGDPIVDPRGGAVAWQGDDSHGGSHRFADGSIVDAADPRCSFSPDGRWFAATLPHARGIVLLDRDHGRQHRLRGWQLYGWHPSQPWLQRSEYEAPLGLKDVLGQGGTDAARP